MATRAQALTSTVMTDGILLGLANTIVVGVCLALSLHAPFGQVLFAVVLLGFIPACIIGMIEGWIAHGLTNQPRWLRLTALGRRVLEAESERLEDLVRVLRATRPMTQAEAES